MLCWLPRHTAQPVLDPAGLWHRLLAQGRQTIIQVDINPDRIGLTKKVTVGIVGDAKKVATLNPRHHLSDSAGDAGRDERKALIAQTKSTWAQQLSSMDHEEDDPGTNWNERARADKPDWMSPRMAWRAIQSALAEEAIISSDIGNNCAIGNAYPSFEEGRKYLAPGLFGPCGYGLPSIRRRQDRPARCAGRRLCRGRRLRHRRQRADRHRPRRLAGRSRMVVFRNYQWGAEKRNTTLWYDNNFVGTELDRDTSYAKIAEACGAKGVVVKDQQGLTEALAAADRAVR